MEEEEEEEEEDEEEGEVAKEGSGPKPHRRRACGNRKSP